MNMPTASGHRKPGFLWWPPRTWADLVACARRASRYRLAAGRQGFKDLPAAFGGGGRFGVG